MNVEYIILILILAILLLIGCFYYLHVVKVKKQRYEEELVQNIKFENRLKKEETLEEDKPTKPQVDLGAIFDKMQADLEAQNQDKIVDFEQEQEETSIISYKELKRATKELTEEEERAQEQSPISLKEILSLREEEKMREEDPILSTLEQTSVANVDESSVTVEEPRQVHPVLQQEKKKFQNTDFISPIYGKQEQKIDYPHIPVYTEQEEVLSVLEEDKKVVQNSENENENFLNELKDFRNQL